MQPTKKASIAAVSILLLAALLAPNHTHAAVTVPPSPTVGEPVTYPATIYLPIIITESK